MPAEDGGRLHREQGTGGQLPAEGGQDHAIGHAPARLSSSAAEDEQLLAEDKKLEIAIGGGTVAKDEEVDQQAEEGIEEGQRHGRAE